MKLPALRTSLLSRLTYSASKSESLLQEKIEVNINNIKITFCVNFENRNLCISRD